MIIDRAAYDAMIQHMREAAPREGVGLLAGPRATSDHIPYELYSGVRHVDRWVPQVNVSEFPRARYEVAPEQTIADWQALDDDGRRPWIVCHSHVTTSAAPSPNDIRYAVDNTLLHMIVSVAGSEPVAVLWRLDPGRPGPEGVRRVRYQVADLGFHSQGTSDLTHRVTGPTV